MCLLAEIEGGSFNFGGFSSESEEYDFTTLGGGLKIGYQWVWDSGFSLDLNLGASYKSFSYDFNDNTDSSTEDLFKASGVIPTFGFGLGYAW